MVNKFNTYVKQTLYTGRPVRDINYNKENCKIHMLRYLRSFKEFAKITAKTFPENLLARHR